MDESDNPYYRLDERRAAIDSWLSGSLADGSIDQNYYDQVMGLLGDSDAYVDLYKGQRDVGSYFNEYGSWYNTAAGALEGMDWAAGVGAGSALDAELAQWGEREAQVRQWLEDNKDRIGQSYYDQVIAQLDSNKGYTDRLLEAYRQTGEYFSQFDSQEGMDNYYAAQERDARLESMTPEQLEDAQARLEEMRKDYDDLYELEGEYGLLANDAMPEEERARYQARYDEIMARHGEGTTSERLWEQIYKTEEELNSVSDRFVRQADMERIQALPAEDLELLKSYVAERNGGGNLNSIFKISSYYEAADAYKALKAKYGEEQTHSMAETLERVQNEEAYNASYEAGRSFGEKTGALGIPVNVLGNLAGAAMTIPSIMETRMNATGRYRSDDPYTANAIAAAFGKGSGETGAARTGKDALDLLELAAASAAAGQAGTSLDGGWRPSVYEGLGEGAKSAVDKGGAYLYQATQTAADSLARAYLGAGLFGAGTVAAEATTLGLAALSSFGDMYSDASARGATPGQALALASVSSGLEVLTEKLPLDEWWKVAEGGYATVGEMAWNILKQAGIEITTEELSLLGTTIADFAIMKDNAQYSQLIQQLMDSGMSKENAEKQALMAFLQEALDTAVVSGLSGAGSTTVGYIASNTGDPEGRRLYLENRGDISEVLQNAGVSRAEAKKIAGAYALDLYGIELTEEQRERLDSAMKDEKLAAAIREAVGKDAFAQRNGIMKNAAQDTARTDTDGTDQDGGNTEGDKTAEGKAVYTVSEDGMDHLISAPEKSVNVAGIASTDGGKVTVRLEDGGTADLEDVSFGDEGKAVVYSFFSDMSKRGDGVLSNMSADTMNEMIGLYDPSVNPDAFDFAAGVADAYFYGYEGIVQKSVPKGMTEAQYTIARNYGAMDGMKAATTADEKIRKKGAKTKGDRKGRLHFDRKGRTFSKVQETSLKALEALSEALGVDIYIYESYEKGGKRVYQDRSGGGKSAPNGWYDTNTGAIHIDLNSGNFGQGTMMFTVAHELTHFIKQWSPTKFRKLAQLLTERYAEQGVSVRDLIDAQIAKAKRNGRTIDRDTAVEEVVADSMEVMLTQGDAASFMAQLKQKDKTLWEKIRDWFKDLAKKLRDVVDAYKGYTPDSPEGRMVAQMEDFIGVLQEAYSEALMDASENYRAADGQKNTTREGGRNYSERYIAAEIDPNVLSMVSKVSSGNYSDNDKVELGSVPDNIAARIREITGVDPTGFRTVIEARQMFHILNDHGPRGKANHSMEDPNDIARIKYVIFNPDNISGPGVTRAYTHQRKGKARPAPTVLYEKNIGEKSYYVVQAVPDTKAKTLYIVSAFIGESGYKKEASQLINASNGPDATAKTGSVVASKNSIRSAEPIVKPESTEKRSDRDPTAAATAQELEKQNAKLRQDVADLRELLSLQGKLTKGTEFKKSSIEAAVKGLTQTAGATLDADGRKQLYDMLKGFYKYIASDENLAWEGVREEAGKIADFLQSNVKFKPQRSEYANDVLKYLRGQRVRLSETQRAEVEKLYGYENYRKQLFGAGVYLSKDGISLDSLWHEAAGGDMFPGTFDADILEGNQPAELLRVIDGMREEDGSGALEYAYNREFIRQDLIQAVYDSYWRVDNLYSVADRKQKEINEIRRKHDARMDTLKKNHWEAVQWLKEERRAAIEEIRDTRKRDAAKYKIRNVIRDLNKLLARGDKKRNVKEGMQELAVSALASAEVLFSDSYSVNDMIRRGVGVILSEDESKLLNEAMDILADLDSAPAVVDEEAMAAWMKREAALNRRLSKIKSELKGVFERERIRMDGLTVSSLLQDLADAYAGLMNAEEGYIRGAFDENVYEHLLDIKNGLGYTSVRDMRLDQLEALYDAYKSVLTTIRNANKLFSADVKETMEQLATKTMVEVNMAGKKQKRGKFGVAVNSFAWNNLKPVYAFEKLGSNTMQMLYGNIRKGQDTWAVDMTEANAFRLEAEKKYGFDSWDMDKTYSFSTSSGKTFDLNLQQIMSIYAYSKRKQAHDHLLKGGIVFEGTEVTEKDEKGRKRTYIKEDATAYSISMETLSKIIGKLTKEQMAYADDMQKYLSATMGDKGNEVSMKLYGIKLFKEDNYFPLRSAGQFQAKTREADLKKEQGQISIVNSGFAKAVTPNASNPVILSEFGKTWASHVNEMSMYHAFVLPMEDFRRVYNYSTPHTEEGDSVSVNAAIQNSFGTAATDYIDQLYRDLNGGAVSDPREGIAKKMVGLFKKGAVMASASVVLQQPSSIGRAFAMIDPKHFGVLPIARGTVRAAAGAVKLSGAHDRMWAELKKYAPVAMIKEMGYFDTGMGRSAVDFLQSRGYTTLKEKAAAIFKDRDYRDEVLSRPAAVADEMAWIQIWQAVKNETAAKFPSMNRNSDAFLRAAGQRFAEVIDRTQVYDSVLSRSANMRSKSLFMNMATSFMAEPTTTANMVEDALRKGRNGQKMLAARTLGSVFVSILINSALSSIIYAMRDDDEDETFLEKYISRFITEMLDGINPVTYFPFVKDVWSALQGFDIERADMSVVTDIADILQQLVKLAGKDTSTMDDNALSAHKKKVMEAWLSVADAMANLLGIPLKNVRRDIDAVINFAGTIKADIGGRKTTWRSLGDILRADIQDSTPVWGWLGGETKAEKLYDAIISGDDAYVERLMGGYKDQDAAQSAIRDIVKEKYLSGDISKSEAREYLSSYGGVDIPDTYWKIKEWDTGNTSRYEDVYKAALAGDDIADAVAEMAEHGSKTEKEVLSELKSQIGTWYTDPESDTKIDREEARRMLEQYFDMDSDEVEEQLLLWDMKVDAGFSYSDLKQRFLDKAVSKDEAIRYLTEYAGHSQEDAQAKVDDWTFEAENGWAYEDRASLYKEDKITREQLVDALIDVGEYSREDATTQADVYDWQKQGLDKATVARVRDYNKYCKEYNVPRDIYIELRLFADNTENDVDEDGKKISYSAVKKIMERINGLPITAAQKDAIARSLGWSDKTIRKYKLW